MNHTLFFTPAQLQKANALAGDLELAPTEEESLRMIATVTDHARWLRERREWAKLESYLQRLAALKHDHVRLFGKRV